MAMFHFLILQIFTLFSASLAATFTITNNCTYTVWPGILTSAGTAPLETTGFALQTAESRSLSAPSDWNGRFLGRTLCTNDSAGKFTCTTGDCGGSYTLQCSNSSAAPLATLAEFALNGYGGLDFYDVSLVDGYNLPMLVVPQGRSGSGNCSSTGCLADLNGLCPSELKVAQSDGNVVACKSACDAFGSPQYCCSGAYGSRNTCKPTSYSKFFKKACPMAYSYEYDDSTSTFTCANANYSIIFCPSGNKTCTEAELEKDTYTCRSNNSACYQESIPSNSDFGYHCRCLKGYEGNPYIPNGCIDINECETPLKYGCYGMCINIPGNYKCFCPPHTHGDPTKACYPIKKSFVVTGVIIAMSTALALLLLSMSIYYLWKRWKERTLRKIKERHFRKNKGLFLQQLISSDREIAERTKIFSLEELEKATNHFDATSILGQGGHGTVYKGILPDQRVAAIKKAKLAQQKEIVEFINEVVILSQINHKNVVRLFGCCLESEVPLLVYEFVPNKTLSNHLECRSSLSWEDRLRIASETASALAYLHSSTSISIFHRDVKSSNILLDENFTAKVSDFGASRTLPRDQTHLTTIVQGTYGYLDPEYYQTSQLTEKSDVYSFGVILLELLTGEKPISSGNSIEEINLGSRFLLARREKRSFQLLEPRVKEEATEEELSTLTTLAEMCLRLRGDERPPMKDVEVILEGLRRSKSQKHHNTNEQHYELRVDLQNQSSNSCHQEHVEAVGAIDGNSQDRLRIISLEKEFILSLDWPR